ncbi:transmembrane protein 201 isoform X1 [Entelurus aequoreus]|uniref:transmembrane protein 201 isoform X1 n=1 Tax=Entelurus aequoreus TaxID=161455 RepID=UPI002B1D154E|nr:transmembrane protein 201 isoform X1 [Entelurus aequoreus]
METLNVFVQQYPQVLCSATAFVAGGALIYKLANRKKPLNVKVNCWFCNQDTVVPYGNRNCWDCPNCDQYNGFQDNGDYNKPIPAQYTEDLNHGVSGSLPAQASPGKLQWVNSKMLLCRKCNHNQSTKIKLLSSFMPKDDGNYDEEIDAYKCHLEEHYKLCRPCQAAVDYYIKYQNRQLRTVLLSNQLKRTQDSLKGFIKGFFSSSCPLGVVLLRCLATLMCAFLLATSVYPSADQPAASSGKLNLPKPSTHNASDSSNKSDGGLLELLPLALVDYAKILWLYGQANQMVVVCVGVSTCLTGVLLAGPARLRRIDAVSSVLWFLVLCWYMLAEFVGIDASSWMDTTKHITTAICCIVSFAAAIATRNPLGQRRGKYRRYLSGSSARSLNNQPTLLTPEMIRSFVPSPPPNISKLVNQQKTPPKRKDRLCSLPRRLSSALCLGTISTFTRTDSGYLFSGSKPGSFYKDSPSSDYFSMKSCSRPSSPGPSPTPSVDGSGTSSSSSARQRRPLISPARFNLNCQKPPKLYSIDTESTFKSPLVSSSHFLPADQTSVYSGRISPDMSLFQSQSDLASIREDGGMKAKESNSSGSLTCLVGTTTPMPENSAPSQNVKTGQVWMLLLFASLSTNLLFAGLWMFYS